MADWHAVWRGHLLRFDRETRPAWAASTGLRLLAIVALLELVLGPRLGLLDVLGLSVPAPVRVPSLLLLALVLVRGFARISFAQLGLRRWRDWSAAEKWYFVEVVVLANVVFGALYPARWHAPAWMAVAFAWGFYQELIYRGLLQAELVRRFGAALGVIGANVAFTFGPLHFYHWHDASPLPMFAAIFAIGLFFAIVFRRSRNLWMVGVFHGIGNAWILAPGAS